MNIVLRLLSKRKNPGLRATTTRQAETGQQEGRGHELNEPTTSERIVHFTRSSRKFSLGPLLKLRSVSQLVQTSPISWPRLR